WKSVPFGNIGQCMVYRKDWFDQVGATTFPDTWEEFLEVGIKLKKAGHPYGMSMGHGYADNNSWLLPLLWGFGAQVVAKDGKTVTLDSAETARADGSQAGGGVVSLGADVPRAVPARLRQGRGVEQGAALQALSEGARDRKARVLAGGRGPQGRRGREQVDRHRHVRQGVHGHA